MLTEVIRKLDRAVLEIALIDAFCDLCFYEGEEFTQDLINYLNEVDNGTNTEEQDNAFFEISMPYVEKSLMIYSSTINEGIPEVTVGADKNTLEKAKAGAVGAEILTQMKHKSRELAKEKLTEAELFEGLGRDMIEAAKEGTKKAGAVAFKTGKALADATKVGVVTGAKQFKKNLLGFKVPKGETPNPSENK